MVNPQEVERRVSMGQREMSKSRVVICGLLRDKAGRIPAIRERVDAITGYFKDYRVLIVENDSTDDTRKKLLEWASEDQKVLILGCGVNMAECSLKLPKTEGHSVTWERITKMAHLRNTYLQYIYEYYYNWDYMIVWDMDILGSIYVDGIASSFGYFGSKKFKADAMCSNGIYRWGFVPLYYDTYAHRDMGDKFHSSKKLIHDINKGLTTRYMRGESPVQVRSCFGGFTIYRISSIIKNHAIYGTSKDGNNVDCEHVVLNKKLKYVFMNPSMLYVVLKND
jgi:hypothetical protein